LPSASLTLSRLVSKLRTRTLTRRRTVSGRTHQNPARSTVPTYLPKNCTTDVWPGETTTSAVATRIATPTGSHAHALWSRTATTAHHPQPASTRTANQPLTARARRWAIATWTPWWPTGRPSCGSTGSGVVAGTVLMAP